MQGNATRFRAVRDGARVRVTREGEEAPDWVVELLDKAPAWQVLFHPRPALLDWSPAGVHPVAVSVEPDVVLGGRLYPAGEQAPAILFFHGNGEIAADYDPIAPLYSRLGVTLLVMDYRGYGRSSGRPTARTVLSDARKVFDAAGGLLEDHGLFPPRLYLMGRSLGSAAAIEVASLAKHGVAGLVVESGFADTFGLLARMGVRLPGADEVHDGFNNAGKVERVTVPSLFLHGQADQLIPAAEGCTLYERCAAQDKHLLLVPGAGHNDLMMVGMHQYFEAIQEWVTRDHGKR